MYYTIQDGNLLVANNEYALSRYYSEVYPLPEDYTEGKYIVVDNILTLDEEYEARCKQEEKQRIQNLSMTRSDFFDGTIKAFGIGYKELHVAIENLLVIIDMPEVDKKVALNNFENALNFYRKHPLFNMISNVEFPVYDGLTVFITVDQWDKFFDETNKGNTDAYKELLPKL